MPTATRSSDADQHTDRWSRFHAGLLRHTPGIVAGVATVIGLITIVTGLFHRLGGVPAILRVVPVPATSAATAISIVGGFLLLRVAAGLRKRKRRAWRIAIGAAAVLTITHVVKGHAVGESALAALLLVLLIVARNRFTAKSDPTSRWFAVRVFVQFVVVAFAYGIAMLYAYPHALRGHPSFTARLEEVALGLVGIDGPISFDSDRFGDILYGTLLAFGLGTALSVLLLVLRPSEPLAKLSTEDETRLRALLDKQGWRDSLGYFALRRDKSVLWSPSGKAAITYRVVSGVALVSGDPIGDPEAWPGAIAEYEKLIKEYAWTPAVMGCSETGATVFQREMDLNAYALGDEAIVEVADFTLDGRPMRGVRQAVTRVQRAGYEVKVRRACDVPAQELDELLRVADAWRGAEVERGFSMALSRVGDPADAQCVVATAHQEGHLRGLLHFVPWGADGLSLDLMRRDRSADNGLNEYMITKLIQGCSDLGVKRVSLNFAVFRDAIERGERIGAGPVLRAWRGLLLFASRWWQIESLYRFNVKFRPYWEPRFLSFPATRDLPRIAFAAMEAEAFLVRPHLLRKLAGRA